jgi:hypothetical protein
MHAVVHPADIQDRDGGLMVRTTMFGLFPFVKKLFATAAIKDSNSASSWQRCCELSVEIVKRSDTAQG